MSKKYVPSEPEIQEICKLIENAAGKFNRRDIFHDVVELMACTISMVSDTYDKEQRMETYNTIIEKHGEGKSNSTNYMGRIEVKLMETFEKRRKDKDIMDILGPMYSAMDIDSHLGQFFTPDVVGAAMAKMTLGGGQAAEEIKEKGHIMLNEPTCGAGGLILAAAQVFNEEGLDYKKHLVVQATDIDSFCAMMCYVQCSAYHIPAIVACADALRDPNVTKPREIWTTPAFFQMGWPKKLGMVA